MRVFIFYLNLGSRVATYCEIAAHFAYNVFNYYKYLIVNLVFATSVYGVIMSLGWPHFLIIALFYRRSHMAGDVLLPYKLDLLYMLCSLF